jgi:hypothetical protein
VIHDVDESLRNLVTRDVLNGSGVDISFEAPTTDWAARLTGPTLSLYLYDIREDLDRRQIQHEEIRDDAGRVTARRPPPRRFKLSYLISAWTQRAEDEHRLLSAVLTCFLRFDALPADVLAGSFVDSDHPLRLTVALPLPPDRSLSDTWSALGGELKPSLDLIVTTPIVTGRSTSVGPLVLEEPRFGIFGPEVPREEKTGRGRGAAKDRVSAAAIARGGPAGPAGSGATFEPTPPAVETVAPPEGGSGRRLTVRTIDPPRPDRTEPDAE